MSISFAVSVVFGSKDEQSKNFKRMGNNAAIFGKKTSKAFKTASKSATSFKTITKSILAAGAIQKGLGLVSTGLRSVTTDFLAFDNSVLSAAAKFKDLDLNTKEGIATLNKLKKTAREVGATTEFNASQAAGGLDFLALAGFGAGQAMALLPGVTNLATVAQVDLATATDIASDTLGAFGLMTNNTVKLTENFKRVQDVMAKTTATSNTSLIDMFEAVKKGGPDFTAAGQDIETFSTLVGAMANAGIKGSEAGTKLRNIAIRLSKPTKEAAFAMEVLGIKVQDSEGNFRDMLDILDDVRTGTAKLGEVQRSAALSTIFGARQTGGLNVILKEGTEKLRAYRDMLRDSSGAAEKMATIMRSSLINRLKSLGSAATEVGFQLFSAFDKQGASAIDALTKRIRKIDLTQFINGIKKVAGFISDLTNRFFKFGESTGIFGAIRETVNGLIPVFKDVVNFASSLFDKFVEIGKSSGFFDKVKNAIKEITPLFTTLFDIVKTVFNLLDDVGAFSALAFSANILLDTITLVAKTITGIWNIIKPIVEAVSLFFKEEKAKNLIPVEDPRAADRRAKNQTQLDPKTILFREQRTRNIQEKEVQRDPDKRAPNQTQLESRQQNVEVSGRIDLANAPEGTKFFPAPRSARGIDFNQLGPAN